MTKTCLSTHILSPQHIIQWVKFRSRLQRNRLSELVASLSSSSSELVSLLTLAFFVLLIANLLIHIDSSSHTTTAGREKKGPSANARVVRLHESSPTTSPEFIWTSPHEDDVSQEKFIALERRVEFWRPCHSLASTSSTSTPSSSNPMNC